jgi:drug/metabolite transporter (DMT)-like permease
MIYSASLVWIKRIGDDSPPLAITIGTLAVSMPLFVLIWAFTDGGVPDTMPVRDGAAIIYLGVFGSVLALILGILFNGETVPVRVWVGAAMIALGLSVHPWKSLAGVLAPARK